MPIYCKPRHYAVNWLIILITFHRWQQFSWWDGFGKFKVELCSILATTVNEIQMDPANQQIEYLEQRFMLCMGLANERRRYNVTSSLIGWAHTHNSRFAKCTVDIHQINHVCIYFFKHKIHLYFSINSQHWGWAGNWSPSSLLSDLAVQGARNQQRS